MTDVYMACVMSEVQVTPGDPTGQVDCPRCGRLVVVPEPSAPDVWPELRNRWPYHMPPEDSFGAWLDRQRCVECGDRATHRDGADTVCNRHMTDDARALND